MMVYVNTRSKPMRVSKKKKAAMEALKAEQRALKKSIEDRYRGTRYEASPAEKARAEQMRAHREMYPSVGGCGGSTAKVEPQKYTGDLIVGIATMHKSNAVPVMRGTTQAEDIAKMRR